MKKTQRRRKLYGKTRRRRQRGGDKRLLYLALFAWVVAVARALGNTTVIPKNLATSQPVYDDAMNLFTAFKSEKQLLANDVGSIPPAERVKNAAIGLADLYEKSDAAVNQGVLHIAKLAGEKLVEGDKTITGFFNWVSSSAFALADKLEKGTPLLLEDIPADVGAEEASTSAPSVPLVQTDAPRVNDNKYEEGDKLLVTGDSRKYERDIFPGDIVIFERMGTMANVDDLDDDNDVAAYVVKRLNDDREYYLPVVGSVTLTKKGGSRKQRRKTLRRK